MAKSVGAVRRRDARVDRLMSWFTDSRLKAHVMYVSPEWAPERGRRFDPEQLTSMLASAGVTALELYCKDIHGYTYYPSDHALGEPYPRDVLAELLAACRARGIRFIAYHSIGWDLLAARGHPDWQVRDRDGRVALADVQPVLQLPWLCINTGYRALALARIAELVDRYDVDGFFIDIFMDNIPTACYCESCEQRFVERQGRAVPTDLRDPSAVVMLRTFQADSYHEFLAEARAVLHARRPDALLTFNFVGGISAHSTRFSELVDWHEVEAHAPDYLAQSRTARILRSQGKPFEIMSPGCTRSIREGGPVIVEVMGDWMSMVPKPLVATKLEAAIALAHGGTLTLGIYPRPDGSLPEPELHSFLELGRWVATRRASFESVAPVRDVAVLWNEGSYAAASLELFSRVDLLSGDTSIRGLHAALVGEHVQFDIVRDGIAVLDAYQVVILPEGYTTDASSEELLRAYVAAGGTLIVLYRATLTDGLGGARAQSPLGDVMGVERTGTLSDHTRYVRVDDRELGRDLPDVPHLARGGAIEYCLTTARCLARFVPQLAPRTPTEYVWPTAYNPPGVAADTPAITIAPFGAGACATVAFPLASNVAARGQLDPTPRQLRAHLVRAVTSRPFLRTNAPHLVEVTANVTAEGGVTVHLINTYAGVEGHTAHGPTLPTLGELRLDLDRTRLPERFVVEDDSGRSLPTAIDQAGQRIHLELPLLREHLAISVRPRT